MLLFSLTADLAIQVGVQRLIELASMYQWQIDKDTSLRV